MFLRAGAVSLALLLASRLLGLLRESAQAAAFGASGMADLVVLMLTLPDWLTGLVASGAMAYVLLPAWAGMDAAGVAGLQRWVMRRVLLMGVAVAMGMVLASSALVRALVPGADGASGGFEAIAWSAAALPLALVAALWTARLQHGRDFVGMYGSNVVVNVVLIAGIGLAGAAAGASMAMAMVGAALVLAMGMRLGWQWRRMRRAGLGSDRVEPAPPPTVRAEPVEAGVQPSTHSGRTGVGAPGVWLWAILAAGLPLALPFAARSVASAGGGEGALATFHYAWKLLELPLVLVIQLVAALAFPAVARAVHSGLQVPEARRPLQHAYGLAWLLACAAAAVLLLGSSWLAALLFGWGRMPSQALETIGHWAAIGAWGLLPQAVAAVALTVLASQRRMAAAAALYGGALALLGLAAWLGVRDGAALMALLNALYAAVAIGLLAAAGAHAWRALPWRALAWPFAGLLAAAALRSWVG